jgi:hypothetical protein
LSVHPFEKMPLNELLMKTTSQKPSSQNSNQLELFNL